MTMISKAHAREAVDLEPPPPDRRRLAAGEGLANLWRARSLVARLAGRDISVRYKQTLLGAGWAIFNPLMLLIVFTIIFTRVAKVDTHGASYVPFAYIGLLTWTFFASAFGLGSMSLLNNVALINKIHLSREVFPLATVMVSAVDFGVASILLSVLLIATHAGLHVTLYLIPMALAIQFAVTIGVVIGMSALLVFIRDFRHVIPIVLQIGILATPVAYDLSAIPAKYRYEYLAINPIAASIDAYRHALLSGTTPDWTGYLVALTAALLYLVGGYLLFKRLEPGVADVA